MNTSIQHPELKGIVQPSGDSSQSEATLSARRKLPGRFTFAALLAGLLLLLFSAPAARAQQGVPPGCAGSGLGIFLDTPSGDSHVGCTICYSITVLNGGVGPKTFCDASNITAFVVTPDSVIHSIPLATLTTTAWEGGGVHPGRTYLSNAQWDYYTNVVCYTIRTNDILSDGTVRATARDIAVILQNDTPSASTNEQGVNTEVSLPGLRIAVSCVPSVGENGAITYTGTVTNTGNNTLFNVTVTNSITGWVTNFTSIAVSNFASFSGFWVPLNPCIPSTNTFTAIGNDSFTNCLPPAGISSSTNAVCMNTLTTGIKVTKTCSVDQVPPGYSLSFSGSVSNTGNVTLTNIVVVNNQPSNNTLVFTLPSLAPNAVATFNGSYPAPTNCSVTDTLTARASSICGFAVTNTDTKTCTILTTPQITVAALCPTAQVVPGGSVIYSVTVQNTGYFILTNISVFSDQAGPPTNPVKIVASLAAGASTNFNVGPYTVPANACWVSNTFSATGKDLCTSTAATNTASTAICQVITTPGIGVKLNCPASPAVAGGLIIYTGTVTNSGNVILNPVNVVDGQSGTLLSMGPLSAHAFANFTVTNTAPTNACSVSDTVTAMGYDNCTGFGVTNTASTTNCTLITTPGIQVTKFCPDGRIRPGQPFYFTGSVSNTGNITLTNIFVFNNQPSNNAPVYYLASLLPGTVAYFNNATNSYLAPTNCSVTDTLTARATSICGMVVTNYGSNTCTISTTPQITVTALCPINPVVPGGSLTYSVMVTNTGDITLTNVVVFSDRSVPNTILTLASLAPGVSTNFNVTYLVPADACMVTTTFSVTGNDCTPSTATNNFTSTCTVITAPAIAAKLNCPTVPAVPGGLIIYTGTVTNSGNVILNNVTVVDGQSGTHLPVGSLSAHASASFTVTNTAPANACSVSDTVTVTGNDNCTRFTVTNTASTTNCTLNTTPGIKVTKLCYDQRVAPGQPFYFSGSVSNTGNITLTNIVVVNNQPVSNTLVITVASLAPGAVTNFTASYVAPTNCSVTDTLIATGRSICGAAVSSTNSATCPILTTPAIVVTTACPTNLVGQGGLFTFSGTVSNAGNITLTNIIVVNNWPSSNVVFTVGSLAPGATTNFTGSYLTPLNCCQAWIWVVASGQGCDGFTVTDTDSRTCTVFTSPSIVVTKVCDPRRRLPQPGDTLHYSGTVSNAGNITLVNVTVVDNQPANNTPVIWNVDPPGPIILAPGETAGYTGSYTVLPDFCGADTVTASGQDACSYALVTTNVTATCPIFTTPRIGVSKQCPQEPTPHGGLLTFFGTVSNMGNVTLTNVYVVNNQPTNNTPVIGPVILPPGDFLSFTGSYTAPLVCCEIIDTLTARGRDNCSGSNVTATATAICPTLYTPGIALVPDQPCPPNLLPGSCYCFSGYVTNTGDAILTNVVVFSTGYPCQLNGVNGLPSLAPDGQILSLIQTNLGPLTLAPGQAESYSGCLTVPYNTCEVTVTVTSQEICEGTWITNTISCPITTTPCISITEDCPPGPVTIGDFVNFTGLVCNCGTITLTNVNVYSSQLNNQIFALIGSHDLVAATPASLVLGPITLLPGACAPFSGGYYATGGYPTTNSTIVTNNSVIITPTNTVTVTPTNTVTVTPTNTVTITTNTVTPTFGTIDPLTGLLTDRFNVPSNLHGLMFADQDENWGPTLFYATQHPVSGPDTFDTISAAGVITPRFNLTQTNYDALTLAAPDVGYGSVNFYYLRHDNLGACTFGEIIAQGASSSTDLWPVTGTGYTGLAFAAANVDSYGANLFYYVRTDNTGLSTFGTINPTPGGVETDRYTVGTNFDALVFVSLSPIPGWGTDYFAYLRHDNTGSIIGTIDPVTHVPTDRLHLGTNFLTGLTFTTTDVGYGPNLFYYLRPAETTFTTNTVSGFVTNTVSGFVTNTVSGFVTNTVTTYTTNSVVSLTTTNTVTTIGWSICQPDGQPVTAAADCVGPIIPLVLDIGTTIDPNGGFMLSLSFPTQIGRSYYVQYTDVLIDPNWLLLPPGTPVPGTGGIVTIPEPIDPGQPARFYRIMITTP